MSVAARRMVGPAASWARRCSAYSKQSTFHPRPRISPITTRQSQEVFHSQLEDSANASLLDSFKKPIQSPQTLTEKIFSAYNVPPNKPVLSGDFITLKPRHCMTHDNSWPVATKFMEMGATKVHSSKQLVIALDHDVQNKSETNLKKYRMIEQFARQQGVDFYPAGHGIGHQIIVEEGYAWPGSVVVASDSHTNMYGGIGCLGTPVVRTGAADIWATGTTWLKVPAVAKVAFKGTLPVGTTGKDVIVALCALFNNDEVLNHAIEFVGSEETMRSLPIDDRLTIANMTTEWGALSGLFPVDNTLQDWFREKANKAHLMSEAGMDKTSTVRRISHKALDTVFNSKIQDQLKADPGARYAKSLFLDLSTVAPCVSGPNSVKIATPIKSLEEQKIKVDKAYLVSCTNSRASDLGQAAKVFRVSVANGKSARIADGVKLYIAAASESEWRIAEANGDWQVLLDAGATPLPSGCGPCIGLGTGLLEPGEVGISASNRNFKGRMGSIEAKAYLGSPEVVAASALNGYISSPGWYAEPGFYDGIAAGEGDGIERRVIGIEEALEKFIGQADSLIASVESGPSEPTTKPAATIVPGFPTHIRGEIIFCDADNINTDGIYPGKYTYQDGVTREKMAEVCMENYDKSFGSLAKPGDILVSGYNFGCGSSREQAATCILAKEIPLVVAGSFGNIFTTNSINNALMGLEVPRLVSRLRETFSKPTTEHPENPITESEANEQSLDSPPPAPVEQPKNEKTATRRTGWTLTWDVARSTVSVTEGPGGNTWEEKVPEISSNVQAIIAGGGLVKSRQSMFGKE